MNIIFKIKIYFILLKKIEKLYTFLKKLYHTVDDGIHLPIRHIL